jgi:hypothetical protein
VKARVLGLALLLALFAAFLTRGAGPGSAPPRPRAVPPDAALPQPLPEAPPLDSGRDPFRYLEAGTDALSFERAPALPPPPEASAAPPTPAPLRLLGFVRRGEVLMAALSVYGVVVTAGPGESAEGYEVLAVDEDTGVRLRGLDGSEVALDPPSE